MPTVVPVKFKYAARDLWFDPMGAEVVESDHVICQTERGTEIGIVTGDPQEVSDEEQRSMCGDALLKPVLRIADDDDLLKAELLAERGEDAMPTFRRLVNASGLDMKPVGVEYLFGGEKVVCYFSAEERVDFRQLVRDMARELHERIDMRQIGVREEAAIVGGFAHCGQELCCARFGHQFEPVSIRMAKEQDLPLNSTKISGACGRLMCCLRYEFEAYRDFKGRAPKKNAVIETPLGKGKIIEYDTPKEQITLRLENGKQVRVALADMEASEAAVKKSEELHCPCRPDTAPRAALERLATPEVQLALAELDREMGILPEEVPDESDIFVEPPRSRRRRRVDGASAQGGKLDAEQHDKVQAQEGEGTSARSRRRRKKRAAEGEQQVEAPRQQGARPSRRTHAAAEGTQAGDQQAAQPKVTRRRRHHTAEGQEAAAAQPKQTASAQGERPTRRRRNAAEGSAPQAAAQQGEAKPQAKRPRRRPGDHGGERAQAAAGAQAPKPKPATEASEQGEGAAPKRRRRHRGGRGRGKGAGDGQTPPPTSE